MSPEERFAIELKATAEACADDYFREVADWPEDAPVALWEAAWSTLVDGVTDGVSKMCHNLGMDAVTSQAVLDSALTFVFARFDVVNDALIQQGGRAIN